MDQAEIYVKVQERYSAAANSDDVAYGHNVATAFGYSEEELASIPLDANLGLSCGNPLALAKLREVCQSSAHDPAENGASDCRPRARL